jgi:protein kinase-like protein
MISRRIVSALVDGEGVSWREASRLADTPRERQLVADLQWIESVSSAAIDDTHPPAGVRLPFWASMAMGWAQLQIAFGLAALALGAPHGSRFVVPQVLLVVSFWAASGILARGGTGDLRARWLALVYALTATSFAHAFLVSGGWTARLFSHAAIEALIPAAVWRFAQVFPRTERFSRFDRLVGVVCTATLAVGCGLIAVNLLLFTVPALVRTPLALLDRGDHGWRFWAVVYPLALPGLVVPLLRASAASAAERRRVWHFTAALAFGMTPILAFGIVEQFAPGVAALWTDSPAGRALVDRVVLGALLLVPPATTYAILSRHALTIRFVLERATRYLLARSSLALLATIPASLLGLYLFEHRDESLSAMLAGTRGKGIVAWLGIAVAAVVVRRQLLALVDRAFRSSPIDHGRALAEAIAVLRGAAGITPVLGILAGHINRVFGSVAAVLRLDSAGNAQPLYGKAGLLPAGSAILAITRDAREPVTFHGTGSILDLLPPADRAWVDENGVELVLPLKRAEGDPLALLAVGARRDRFPWAQRDLDWLTALADAAALALDGAFREIDRADGGAAAEWQASECRACGAIQVHPGAACACGGDLQPALLPPLLHGKFAVERRIGRGGMGVVYQGRDLGLQRPIALKTLPHLDAEAAARMRAEARTMGSLMHPNVATIFTIELWQRTPVLVLELLEGGTLAQRLRRTGPLPPAEAIALCRILGSALSALHAGGLVHGDVKPSNIGFAANGVPKLLDFGLADLIRPLPLETGMLAGTPQYLPPEAYEGRSSSAAFDLWALSVVLFEALTGVNPFAAPTLAGVKDRVRAPAPPDARAWRGDIPEPLASALTACLQPDSGRRPPTADAWLAAFARIDLSVIRRPA